MPRKAPQAPLWSGTGKVRLQRVLAAAGFGSRRSVESLIVDGRVEVDGETIDQLGFTVDPEVSEIRVDGESLKSSRPLYFAVNKPVGVVTTHRDPQGRPRVVDLAPPDLHLFPVGRLDQHSEGLILLTNDGALAQRLTHPKFGVEKTYLVTVAGEPPPNLAKKLERGVHLAEGVVKAKHVRVRSIHPRASVLEIILDEGKNREIRRMLARIGHKVLTLRRIAFGPLRLGDLPIGACRPLMADEIQKLRDAASGKQYKPKRERQATETKSLPEPPEQQKQKSKLKLKPPAKSMHPRADDEDDDDDGDIGSPFSTTHEPAEFGSDDPAMRPKSPPVRLTTSRGKTIIGADLDAERPRRAQRPAPKPHSEDEPRASGAPGGARRGSQRPGRKGSMGRSMPAGRVPGSKKPGRKGASGRPLPGGPAKPGRFSKNQAGPAKPGRFSKKRGGRPSGGSLPPGRPISGRPVPGRGKRPPRGGKRRGS